MARSKTRRALLVLAGVAPLVACNSILGISDYDKADCPGGNACYAEVDAGSGTTDAGVDATTTLVDAQGADPVSWARFRMPNYAQDGVPDASVPKYEPAADGALRDSVSALVWRPVSVVEAKSYNFADARKLCEGASGGPWRLPTRIELVTLLDFSQTAAKSDPAFKMEKMRYWTTSQLRTPAGHTQQRLLVGFDGASANVISAEEETGTARAICVQAK